MCCNPFNSIGDGYYNPFNSKYYHKTQKPAKCYKKIWQLSEKSNQLKRIGILPEAGKKRYTKKHIQRLFSTVGSAFLFWLKRFFLHLDSLSMDTTDYNSMAKSPVVAG